LTAQRPRQRFTFHGNVSESRHGWLRLTPAYSVHLVRELLEEHAQPGRAVLDPFCGTGTTLLTCAEAGLDCLTVDVNPFLVWLAKTKTAQYSPQILAEFLALVRSMGRCADRPPKSARWTPPLHKIERWWDPTTLTALAAAFHKLGTSRASPRAKDLARLAFCRTLIRTSKASFGHQSMSFQKQPSAQRIVASELQDASERLAHTGALALRRSKRHVRLGDARALQAVKSTLPIGVLITSPPYANRMSYVRELRPYMYWLGYLHDGRQAGELDWRAIGGTWGIATSRLNEWQPSGRHMPRALSRSLRSIRDESPLLANYVARYFDDMQAHLSSVLPRIESGGSVHYVVGNSKFFDEVVAVEQLLATQLSAAGFRQVTVNQLRKRTSKRELYEYLVSAKKP
jgi:hypothetical protein